MARHSRSLVVLCAALTALVIVSTASTKQAPQAQTVQKAQKYIVVLKLGQSPRGLAAIQKAGGTVVNLNKLGIATATSKKPSFEQALRTSGAVVGVAPNGWFGGGAKLPTRFTQRTTVVKTVPGEQAPCSALYSVPANIGPDPLGACQWDMRAISATPSGSYAVNQGAGARIGDIDTGIDFSHPDLAPNIDVAASCSFIYATTPTSNPAERVTR